MNELLERYEKGIETHFKRTNNYCNIARTHTDDCVMNMMRILEYLYHFDPENPKAEEVVIPYLNDLLIALQNWEGIGVKKTRYEQSYFNFAAAFAVTTHKMFKFYTGKTFNNVTRGEQATGTAIIKEEPLDEALFTEEIPPPPVLQNEEDMKREPMEGPSHTPNTIAEALSSICSAPGTVIKANKTKENAVIRVVVKRKPGEEPQKVVVAKRRQQSMDEEFEGPPVLDRCEHVFDMDERRAAGYPIPFRKDKRIPTISKRASKPECCLNKNPECQYTAPLAEICPYCDYKPGQRHGALTRHVKERHQEIFPRYAPVLCPAPECDFRAPTCKSIRGHNYYVHSTVYDDWYEAGRFNFAPGTKCPFCEDFELKTLIDYKEHVWKVHEEDVVTKAPFLCCSGCNFSFRYASEMFIHWCRQPYCTRNTYIKPMAKPKSKDNTKSKN